MADEDKDTSVKVTETVEEIKSPEVPLTRKRTRDDFEEGDEENKSEPTERKIAPIKRRKDTAEESNDDSVKETVLLEEKVEDEKLDSKEVEKKEAIDKEETEEKDEASETKEKKEVERVKEEGKSEALKDDEKKEDEPKEENKEEAKKEEKPRFVFGSTTPFGANAFSLMNKNKNVFDSSSSKEASKSPSATAAPVFGSNSKFGNAFQSAVTKKSIFDKTPEEEAKEKEESEKSKESTPAATGHLYKQVELEKKDIKSGEEDEEQVFTCRAKLYTLDLTNVKEGWKERGIGNVHVNKSKVAGKKARVIMRSIGLLKVILNTPLIEGLEVVKGMPSSLASEKFIRITIVESGKPVQYALKTGNPDTTASLYEAIEELIPKSV